MMILENIVTPFVGVWIETRVFGNILNNRSVTPFVGVWIETDKVCALTS